jgi:hypothetical protein
MTSSKTNTLKSLVLATTLFAMPLIAVAPFSAQAQVVAGVSVQIAPPILPVYPQPPMPAVGYIWTPGYWAWADPTGYYWVPGTWVQPPTVGVLWTPPYWGWAGGFFAFHAGYWGPHVGFYGGVNYGFGYGGHGFDGGHWDHGGFVYNRAVNNFGSVHVTNSYTRNVTVINNAHVSYAGGAGGIHAEPTAAERAAEHENHVPPTADQARHFEAARNNPDFAASRNNGRPSVAATSRPGQFEGAGVTHPRPVAAHAGPNQRLPPQAAHAAPKQPQRPQAAHTAPNRSPHAQAAHAAPNRSQHPEAHQAAAHRQQAHQAAAPHHAAAPRHAQAPYHAPARAPHNEDEKEKK